MFGRMNSLAASPPQRPGLRRLRWAGIVLPIAFLVAANYVGLYLLPAVVRTWWGFLLLNLVLLAAVATFSNLIFTAVERMQARLAQLYGELHARSEELAEVHAAAQQMVEQLRALSEASATMTGELALETVLLKVVDLSRGLVGAKYGALLVIREGGDTWFLTSGLDPDQKERLGVPPRGRGLLGSVLEGQPVLVPDIAKDPRSVGFPANHPPMKSFVGVPMVYHGRVLGALYLTNKLNDPEFSREDQEILVLFARHAAVAIENARLYQRAQDVAVLEERERIAREMHDNFAQVLGYVSTKSQAARRLLELGDQRGAESQIAQMEGAARQLYVDVREAVLGLRSPLGQGGSFLQILQDYLTTFSEMSGLQTELAAARKNGKVQLEPRVEVQVFRIVQEALTNVRKHARATQVRVNVLEEADRLTITVEDDGAGFDPVRPVRDEWPHFGLQTMRERAEAVGGSLEIDSSPGRGTRVKVWVPHRAVEEA